MFDMTLFTQEPDGAVLWFKNEQEYDEFARYYAGIPDASDVMTLPFNRMMVRGGSACVRILRFNGRFIWYKGAKADYEACGYPILTLDDIRIRTMDLGEIDVDNSINLSALFATEDENGV